MSDAHEPDMLHVPDSLKELLPQKLASINLVLVQIAEYSVGKLEQARQKAVLMPPRAALKPWATLKRCRQLCQDSFVKTAVKPWATLKLGQMARQLCQS